MEKKSLSQQTAERLYTMIAVERSLAPGEKLPGEVELARELGLSPAAVSKHLKLLREAGLVRKAASGHFVRYTLSTEVIDYLPYTLYEIFTR